MEFNNENTMIYLTHSKEDEEWGFCTTVGNQSCGPDEEYPVSLHPKSYHFSKSGRVLDEYQFVYITRGHGFFSSASVPETQEVAAGNILILFPGERHFYYPDEKTGWSEMWVGFKPDPHLRSALESFFDRKKPVIDLGISDTVFDLYGRISSLAAFEKRANQQAICGFIYALAGYVHYKNANFSVSRNKNIDKIQRAQLLLRENLGGHISPATIAEELGVSYSLLREQFKSVTGMSMAEYATKQKLNLAKTLLTTSEKSIKEIAFETGYESMSRFCCSFRKHEGITASDFRKKNKRAKKKLL